MKKFLSLLLVICFVLGMSSTVNAASKYRCSSCGINYSYDWDLADSGMCHTCDKKGAVSLCCYCDQRKDHTIPGYKCVTSGTHPTRGDKYLSDCYYWVCEDCKVEWGKKYGGGEDMESVYPAVISSEPELEPELEPEPEPEPEPEQQVEEAVVNTCEVCGITSEETNMDFYDCTEDGYSCLCESCYESIYYDYFDEPDDPDDEDYDEADDDEVTWKAYNNQFLLNIKLPSQKGGKVNINVYYKGKSAWKASYEDTSYGAVITGEKMGTISKSCSNQSLKMRLYEVPKNAKIKVKITPKPDYKHAAKYKTKTYTASHNKAIKVAKPFKNQKTKKKKVKIGKKLNYGNLFWYYPAVGKPYVVVYLDTYEVEKDGTKHLLGTKSKKIKQPKNYYNMKKKVTLKGTYKVHKGCKLKTRYSVWVGTKKACDWCQYSTWKTYKY